MGSNNNKLTKTGNIITLPTIPKDKDYEEAIAACLQISGYYLERSVTKQENSRDVLELDIVANNLLDTHTGKTLIEVKSGGTGLKDLFKVRGWMDYIGLRQSALITQKSPDTGKAVAGILAGKLGIDYILDDKVHFTSVQPRFPNLLSTDNSPFIDIVRWNYLVERIMCNHITKAKNDNKTHEGLTALDEYCRKVINYSFFCNGPLDRLHTIVSAFNVNRNITARLAQSFETGIYDKNSTPKFPSQTFNRIFYSNVNPDILYSSLWVEYMTRIAVISTIVEHIVNPLIPHNEFEKFLNQLSSASLPYNINEAISQLRQHPYFARYPHFWQIFTYVMGGFIFEGNKDEEYRLLSQLTDIPVTEIDNALSAFDIVFPQQNLESWLYTNSTSNIKSVKFFPTPLQGIGVAMRLKHLCDGDKEQFQKKYSIGSHPWDSHHSYSYLDMSRWLSLAFNYLSTVAEDKQ